MTNLIIFGKKSFLENNLKVFELFCMLQRMTDITYIAKWVKINKMMDNNIIILQNDQIVLSSP